MDELKRVEDFRFWPQFTMDIFKPAPKFPGLPQQFIWRLPLFDLLTQDGPDQRRNHYIKDINIVEDDLEAQKIITGVPVKQRVWNVHDKEEFKKYMNTTDVPIDLEVTTSYPIHMRYQMCTDDGEVIDGGLYKTISFGNDTKVHFDCNGENLMHFSDKYHEYRANGEEVGIKGQQPLSVDNLLVKQYQ